VARRKSSPRLVGWREWAALPDLGIPRIKAKLDTGAQTSAIHAWNVSPFDAGDQTWVRFELHPQQRGRQDTVECEAPVVDQRTIINSGGHRERRYIIETSIRFGNEAWPIELGLTDRDEMGFRLLIGRAAMRGRLIVDPDSSFRLGITDDGRQELSAPPIGAVAALKSEEEE
jgi:hypothetical protein